MIKKKRLQIRKTIFFLGFLLLGSSIVSAQTSYLTVEELVKLRQNYRFEGNLVGGLKDGRPYYRSSDVTHDFVVRNKTEFLKVLKRDNLAGKTIFIPNGVSIDLSGQKDLQIPEQVTLLGDRGHDGKAGARIFTKSSGTYPLFRAFKGAKVIGLVIEGPDKKRFHNGEEFKGKNSTRLNTYKDPVSTGIEVAGDGVIIENCEVFGWTHSGVLFRKGEGHIVRHSYFHHNQRNGLGYGVTVDGGFAKIYANIFDYNRHDIAGSGSKGSGYEVFMNVFLSNTYLHSVDMHGGADRGDGTNLAGDYMEVYNNYFERSEKNRAVLVRGVPQRESKFENNYVRYLKKNGRRVGAINEDFQFRQTNSKGRVVFRGNHVVEK